MMFLDEVSNLKDRNEQAFMIRVWREPPAGWRGFVEHMPTGLRVYFTDINQVADLLFVRLSSDDFNRTDGSYHESS